MDDFADISRRLENLLRLGTVAQVQMAPPRVRVQSGGLTTTWLPWITLRAGTTREWNPPTVGEQCMLFSPSGEPAAGVVLVGLFSDANPAPSSSPEEFLIVFPDGARIYYNHVAGALEATGIKTALVQASDKCTVDCPESEFTGNVTIDGNLLVKGQATIMQLLTYLSGMAGTGGGAGGGTTITGPINHQGVFTNTGSLSSNGKVLDTHKHPGDSGGTTGVPL